MRLYPALRITFFDSPAEEQLDQVLAELDDYRPTAIHDVPNGVLAFFGSAPARDEALAHFASLELIDAVPEEVPDENWAEKSQAALTPVTVGQLTISPPWAATDELRAQSPGPVIVIQPSMGFGTGHHASTRLCLRLLQETALKGRSVIDIGTGSGVLAISACVLGAARVVGIDFDPDALTNARDNLALNGLSQLVDLREMDASAGTSVAGAPFDVILANLTGGLLIREATNLTALATDNSHLIISGYQSHEVADVRGAFQSSGWQVEAELSEDTWEGMRLRR